MELYIEQGRIQVFCVDGLDNESWSATWKNPKERILAQEAYFNYIINEFVPRVYEINNSNSNGIMTFGLSLGANHALIILVRKPDIFNQVLALAGIYHSGFFIKDYADELTFLNSPLDSLKVMHKNKPYIEIYKQAPIILCVGQGAWEDVCLEETRKVDKALKNLGVPAWVDYWGYDRPHDCPSWLEQVPYFLYHILD
jgi:esterase/lipase superfamily enzyme